MSEKRPTVALGDDIHESAAETLEAAGNHVIQVPKTIEEAALSDVLRKENVTFVGTRSIPEVSEAVIRANPQLDGIGRFGNGLDGIALPVAAETGTAVFKSTKGNVQSVEELVMGGIYALARHIPQNDRIMRMGGWPKGSKGNREVTGSTLAVIGIGGIGPEIAQRAKANGMNVVGYDINPDATSEHVTLMPSLEAALAQGDYVTPHVPLVDATRGLIGEREFAQMKQGAMFINTSRGEVVDMEALDEALRSGHLGGAFLDVFYKATEAAAAAPNGRFETSLLGRENVIFSPHNAGNTEDSQASMGKEVAEKYIRFKQTGSTDETINMPSAEYPEPKPGVTRIFFAHTNQHGALRAVLDIFEEAGGLNVGNERNVQFDNDSENLLSVATFDITQGEVTPGVVEAIRATPLARKVWTIPLV